MNILHLGLLAGVLTSCAVLPQMYRAFRTRQVRDISVWQPVLLVAGMGLWLLYGILIGDLPLIAANIFSIACNLILISLKYFYDECRVVSKISSIDRMFVSSIEQKGDVSPRNVQSDIAQLLAPRHNRKVTVRSPS
jgi:MtN3 and saliva related transmembrane protein